MFLICISAQEIPLLQYAGEVVPGVGNIQGDVPVKTNKAEIMTGNSIFEVRGDCHE